MIMSEVIKEVIADDDKVVVATEYDLSKFKLTRVLSNNTNRKTICVLGEFAGANGENQLAIIIFEKKAFTDNQLDCLFSDESKLDLTFVNDIYSNLECFPKNTINSLKTTIICPATEKHILKYSLKPIYIVQETPQIYTHITLPHLNREQFSIEWVYNILEHKKEFDRIIFEDPCDAIGFILLPDLKWDGTTKETCYCLALVRQKEIKSLRDLTGKHLSLLKNIRDKGVKAIEDKYNIPRSQLRIYFHYQPSFYHLHVHFTFLKHDAPGIYCEKSHLLDTVINNIELMSDYYQKATLSFVVSETDKLCAEILDIHSNDTGTPEKNNRDIKKRKVDEETAV